jgi:hypothetical protein
MLELTVLAAICALVGLGCLGGLAWAILGAEDNGVERIFLLHVWLILGLLFLGMSAWIARMGPLKDLGKKRAEAKSPDAGRASAVQSKASPKEEAKPAS